MVRLGQDGYPDTIQVGTNPMVCFADTPADTLLDVRCYHSAFVPLIYAARRLYRSGISDSAVDARMAEDIRTGRLPRPAFPTAGYRVYGPLEDYTPGSQLLGPRLDRWQSIHQPFATTTEVGVSGAEHGADPYMMAEGTWWAHVMIMQQPLRY